MAIAVYLIVSFAFSWSIALLLHQAGGFAGTGQMAAAYLFAFMFGPAVGALAAAGLFDRSRFWAALSLRPWRWRPVIVWTLIAWVLGIGLCAAGLAVTLMVSGEAPADAAERLVATARAAGVEDLPLSADMLLLITLLVNVPVGIVINTVLITANEELGWRGWLQPRLAGLGFWPSALVIGLIWGVWHAPIVLMGHNYPGLGWIGVALMCVFTTGLTPYIALIRERSANVVPAGAFHGAVNAVAGVTLLFAPDPSWPNNGLLGAAGLSVLYLGWIGVALYRKKNPRAA
ncbi:MAG: CPBP family intramembrane glutamic endopeptidase [Oceanicaulis sp.]